MDSQRQGEAVWCIQLLLAAFPVPRVRELPWHHSWTCGPAPSPSREGGAVLSQADALFLGSKPAFPQFACEAVHGARLLAVSLGFVCFLNWFEGSISADVQLIMKCAQSLFHLSSEESCFSSWSQHKAIAVPFLSFLAWAQAPCGQ